jgi:sugar phosphate isomerase/epimerase
MRGFSVSTSMYPDSSFEVAIDEIIKTGAQAVDLWDTPSYPVNCMDWVWKRRPWMLKEYLANCGLKLFAFSIYWSPWNALDERLEWLAEAGGDVAVLGGGAAQGRPVVEGLKPLLPLAKRAEALGIRIAGENHGGSSLNTIAELREFAALAESPALGVALAPYHVMGNNESVAEAVEVVGRKLFFFYAWQRAPGMAELPGDGTLDFAPVLRALDEVGYTRYLNLFTHTHAPKDEMTAAVIGAREYLERQH